MFELLNFFIFSSKSDDLRLESFENIKQNICYKVMEVDYLVL